MNFDMALFALKLGQRVTNRNWNGRGMYLEIQTPDEHSLNTLPYIYLQFPASHPVYPDARCPWTPSQMDLFSDAWELLEGGKSDDRYRDKERERERERDD